MADFYDPISDIATGWASTGAAHYTEIDDAIRNPNQPTLADYLSTNSNNATDEWGFPAVTGSPPKIVAWLYAETQSKSTIVVSFQQDGVERATITIPINSPKKWYQCAWGAPSGDLSTLTIEVKQVKQGTGAGTYAYVYAAYLRAGPNLDKQVGATGDDGRRTTGTWPFNTTITASAVGYLISTGGLHCHVFARWIGVTYEGTVDVSYMEGFSNVVGDGTPELNIYGVNEDNPPAPTSDAEFDADPLTTAFTPWDGAWPAEQWNQSPSCNDWLQELVDTHGPFTNTAIMAQIKNDHGVTGGDECNYIRFWDYTGNLHGPKLHIEYTAGGESYSIVAAAGSYAVAGAATNLLKDMLIGAGVGDYAVTGAAVGLKRGLVMGIGAGSYALSGAAVGFPVDRVIGAGAGSYSLTGATISLLKDMLMSVAAGSYALTGTAVSLPIGRVISMAPGTYALVGMAINLLKDMLISAETGNYAISGSAASLLLNWVLSVASGSYTITGTDVDLLKALIMAVTAGDYVLTGSIVDLIYQAAGGAEYSILANAGSYSIAGSTVGLYRGLVITASGGTYSISGTAASLLLDWILSASPGTYAITGTAANLIKALLISAGAGNYILAGSDVALLKAVIMAAGGDTYVLMGSDIAFLRGKIMAAEGGSYIITGSDVLFPIDVSILADGGFYIITGQEAILILSVFALPVCAFVALPRTYSFEVEERIYDFVALHRQYDFVAEEKCG